MTTMTAQATQVYSVFVRATPEQMWDAITKPEFTQKYFYGSVIDSTYEPGASYTPLADNEFYGPRLRRLAAVRLRVLQAEAKFKVGPAAPVEVKRNVVRGLRARGEPGDARAADVIESSIRQ